MTSLRLTRRGRVVAAVCVLGVLMAVASGGRALNAVVLSGTIALVAGYLQVSRITRPKVRRSRPADGFVGEHREISLSFGDDDDSERAASTFVARVTDGTDDGLIGNAEGIRTTIGAEPATYTVEYAARGERRFGPVRVEPTDVFGLFTREIVIDERGTALAYPERHPVPARYRSGLYAEEALGRSRRREEFDRLREYAHGDSLRDVHWPATAKHDDLVVKEFAAETARRRASIVGRTVDGADGEAADVLASATVSLGLALLADGVPVDVRLPDGKTAASPGPTGRRDLLELTARTGPGSPSGEFDADVRIVADTGDARIHAGGRTVRFSDLRAEAVGEDESPDEMDATAEAGAAGETGSTGRTGTTDERSPSMESVLDARDGRAVQPDPDGNSSAATIERGGTQK